MNAGTHARILGVLYLLAALVLLGAGALFIVGGAREGKEAALLILFPGVFLVAFGVPPLVIAIGLLLNRGWGVLLGAVGGLAILGASFGETRAWAYILLEDVFPTQVPLSVISGVGAAFAAYAVFVAFLNYRAIDHPDRDSVPPTAMEGDEIGAPSRAGSAGRDRSGERPAVTGSAGSRAPSPGRIAAAPGPRTRPELRPHVRLLGFGFLALAVAPAVYAITPVSVLLTEPGTLPLAAWPAIAGRYLLPPLLLVAIGVGLLRESRRAMFLALLPALAMAIVFPVGTVVAVYIGWVLHRQVRAA